MVPMGWTPKRDAPGSAEDNPSPAPRRRRRAPAAEPETPNVDAVAARSPRRSTGARPRGGVPVNSKHPEADDPRPRQVRVRPGKRWSEIIMAVKSGEYTWSQFCEGLDEEELARGQLRSEDGSFKGRPPSFVPREFLLTCQREQKRRFEEIFGSEVLGIARSYVKLAQDEDIPAKDRAKMMQYAMERIFGGIPKEFKVAAEQPWEAMLVNVINTDSEELPGHLARRYAGYRERTGETEE